MRLSARYQWLHGILPFHCTGKQSTHNALSQHISAQRRIALTMREAGNEFRPPSGKLYEQYGRELIERSAQTIATN
jgi:hypothetical protein